MDWRAWLDDQPFYDAHAHVMHRGMGVSALANAPDACASKLAALLLHYSLLLNVQSAGVDAAEVQAMRSGGRDAQACKEQMLRVIPRIAHTLPFCYIVKGLNGILGLDIEAIDEHNWERIEAALAPGFDDVELIRLGFERSGVERLALNMWESWGVSYYGDYRERGRSPLDERYFADIATFDAHALSPFSTAGKRYAQMVGVSLDSFADVENFIERMARFFAVERGVRGFKITEGYYRPLDYRHVSRTAAKAAFDKEMNPEQSRTFEDYFTWRVLELAEHYGLPVQIHTGELWGACRVAETNPILLEEALRSFPKLRFDLLHCGYPHMAETGILACNHPNAWINMSYMFLRSLAQSALWLDTYLSVTTANRILLGSDVFDVFALYGVVQGIRHVVSAVLEERVQSGTMSVSGARALGRMLMFENAAAMYGSKPTNSQEMNA